MNKIKIKEYLSQKLDNDRDIDDKELLKYIDNAILHVSKENIISLKHRREYRKDIFNEMKRLGELQDLIDDDSITEIMINGCQNIYIEKEGYVSKSDIVIENNKKLEDIAQKIAAQANRIVNQSNPIVDTRLANGSRVNIVLPPIALNGPTITIRKFYKTPITIEKLIELNALNEETASFLKNLVIAKYNIFVSGGTGSGKTTFLNALSNYIPKNERVITIEDSAELQINNIKNLVRMETRNANIEGQNQITIRDLIKSSLRMRPDRIIVGEVRGEEALDMINAMTTGHEGSLSTGHANSCRDMINRIETMVLFGIDMPVSAIRNQIASAVDIVIQLGRLRDKSRRVLEIAEVIGVRNGEVILNTLYEFKESGENEEGKILGDIKRSSNKFVNYNKLKNAGIEI